MHASVLIVIWMINAVSSGVISDLPDDQVEQVLALYHQSCGGGGYANSLGGYGGSSPNEKVSIVCKEPREYVSPEDRKVIRVPPQYGGAKKQVIFVEVPATHFKHEITLVPEPGNDKKTKIYVLPQKADHTIHVDDQRASGPGAKPQVFFLKGNPGQAYPDGYPPSSDTYGPPAPPNYGGQQAQQPPNYGTPPQQPPNYGAPSNPPPPNYGAHQQAPPPNYGAPSNPPPTNYGAPPPQPPQSYGVSESNYGAPQSPPPQQASSSYGPPPEQPPQQPSTYGIPPNPSYEPSHPSSSYGSPPSSSNGIPTGYEVKQTYEISSNGLSSSSNSYSSGYSSSSSSSGNSLSSLTSLLSSPSNSPSQSANYISGYKSPFSSSLSSSYGSPLSSDSDNSISSLLKKLSERIKSYPRRHASFSSHTTPRPSRFMFPSESNVLPVYKPLQLGSRVISRPASRKFSSKFNGKGVIRATEVKLNASQVLRNPPVEFSFIPVDHDVPSTTPYEEEATTEPSHADSAVKNIHDEEESPTFDVLPATYLGYSYILDKSTTPIPSEV